MAAIATPVRRVLTYKRRALKYRQEPLRAVVSPTYLTLERLLPSLKKDDLLDLLSYLSPEEKRELDALLRPLRGMVDWLPQPGPQTLAFYTDAQMLLYGGAAGGGKTDLLLGLGYKRHYKSIIFRREFTQFGAMLERAQVIFEGHGQWRGGSEHRSWYFPRSLILGAQGEFYTPSFGKKLEFGAVKDPGSERKYQGRDHDFKGFDEVTHFLLSQFNYLRGWLRSVVPGLNWQIGCTCNPPQRAEERWIYEWWPNWIDRRRFPSAALPGELRYFIMRQGKHIEVDGPGFHVYQGNRFKAMSRTFIPSSVRDNMYLDDGQYEGVLESLPEPLRSQLLNGDFQAGVTDDEWQLIPTEWILAAMDRWKARTRPNIPVEQAGLDVARGGRDRVMLTTRRGNYVDLQVDWPGKVVTDGEQCALFTIPYLDHKTLLTVDIIGVGTSAFDFLKKYHDPNLCVPFNGAGESVARDRSGFIGFVNQRAEGYWHLRDALDPRYGVDLAIPDDPELLAELQAIRWKMTLRGAQIADKDEIRELLGRSPDKADSLMYSLHQPWRAGQGIFDFVKEMADKWDREKKEQEVRAKIERELTNSLP